MKTTFHVDFWNQQGGSLGYARLEVDLPFAPHMEMQFEHPVWHEGRKPVAVSYNLEEGSLYVVFDHDTLPDPQHLQQHADPYRSHGWTVNGD
jgi:hypothetical protein